MGRNEMTRNIAEYVFGRTDVDYIEATGQPIHPVLATIETDAAPERIPILDRESGRVLAVLAAERRRIVEVGTAIGYSTLWMALYQAPGGSITTIDPDQGRTKRARGYWRQAGIADEKIVIVGKPALAA